MCACAWAGEVSCTLKHTLFVLCEETLLHVHGLWVVFVPFYTWFPAEIVCCVSSLCLRLRCSCSLTLVLPDSFWVLFCFVPDAGWRIFMLTIVKEPSDRVALNHALVRPVRNARSYTHTHTHTLTHSLSYKANTNTHSLAYKMYWTLARSSAWLACIHWRGLSQACAPVPRCLLFRLKSEHSQQPSRTLQTPG